MIDMLKNKKIYFIAAIAIVALIIASIVFKTVGTSGKVYKVKRGNLESLVSCMGEVQGEKAVNIELAPALCDRELRIWGLKIVDLIAEGKSVKKGEYIARLDESMIMNPMREKMNNKEKEDADLKNARIDSTVVLTGKREAITNAMLDLEYKRIDLEQSKYEAGAQQRKAEMAFQKSQIALDRTKRDYLLEKNRQKIKVSRAEKQVEELDRMIKKYQEAMRSTRITAPDDGIIMFGKDWMGKKLSKDSEVGPWNPLIATLPDMSVAISEAYIKEIDISKIKVGDSVRISIDALPDRYFAGSIYHIAAIGEDHKNFDMKVFRVMIRFAQTDSELKPGMTCNNEIIFNKYENAIIVPLDAVFSDNHEKFVYLKEGNILTKKPIKTGSEDELNTVVTEGLNEGDEILMYKPDSVQLAKL